MGKSSHSLAKEKPGSIMERHWFWTLKRPAYHWVSCWTFFAFQFSLSVVISLLRLNDINYNIAEHVWHRGFSQGVQVQSSPFDNGTKTILISY